MPDRVPVIGWMWTSSPCSLIAYPHVQKQSRRGRGAYILPLNSSEEAETALAADWLTRLGKKGFEALMDDIVQQSVDRGLRDRAEPRLASIENRLVAIENRLVAIETRLDVADRLSKLEAEVSALKAAR
jgi:hypothetical protein